MSKFGKLNFKRTPEQVALVKKLGSKNHQEAIAAQWAFAEFIAPILLQVKEQAPVISNLFRSLSYDEGTSPSIPLDSFYDVRDKNYIQVTSQAVPGGLATNFMAGLGELMVSTYKLDSSLSMFKKYAREARLDVLAASLERMAQEILIKEELNAVSILLSNLASARYKAASGVLTPQLHRANTANSVILDDVNRLLTLMARINSSWVGGTPVGSKSITDLIGSPEFLEEIRSMAYEPMNTRNGATTSSGATSLAAPESFREEVFNSSGYVSFYGVSLTQAQEFGVGYVYNTLFGNYMGATTFEGYAQGSAVAFDPTTEELVVGLNLGGNMHLVKLQEVSEGGSTLVVAPDDQFTARSEKFGMYAEVKEGFVALDSRNVCGLVF